MNPFARSPRSDSPTTPPKGRRRLIGGTMLPALLTGLLLAVLCLLVVAGIAGAVPEGAAPVIAAAEPTPDVHEPPIDDRAPAPSPSPEPTWEPIDDTAPATSPAPSPRPLDDKAPPPSPEPSPEPLDDKAPPPSPSPEPIDDVIPAPESDPEQVGRVELLKATCTPGTDPALSLDDLLALCTGDGAGFAFHLLTGELDLPQDTIKHWNSDRGFASWDDVPVDPGTVAEELPAGFGAPVVYCQVILASGFEHPFVLMSNTDDAAIDYELAAAGNILSCAWFNIPLDDQGGDGGSHIVVHKWDCPSGFDAYAASLDDLLGTCTLPMDDVVFNLFQGDGMNATVTEDTTVAGEASWADVALGPFTLGEAIPDGYGAPLIDCRWAAVDDGVAVHGASPLHAAANGTHTHELNFDGTTYLCDWFNVPIDGPGEPGDEPNEPGDEPNHNPGKPEVEITTLPDTGSGGGAAAGRGFEHGGGVMVAGLALLAGALVGARRLEVVRG